MWYRKVLTESSLYFKDHGTATFLLGIIAIIITLYFFIHRNARKLPPGPMGLPIFGYYPFLGKDPAKKMNEVAKKYGNVIGLYLGPQYVVILNDWVAMKDGMSQDSALYRPPSLFASVPYNFGVAGANGPEWVQTRRLFSRAIKDIALNKDGWEDLIKEDVLDLVNLIVSEGETPGDVREMFALSFANSVVSLILGERLHAGHPITRQVSNAVDAIQDHCPVMGMMNFSPTLSKLLQVLGVEEEFLFEKVTEFGKFVSDTVEEKIRKPIESEDSFIGRFQEEIQNHKKDNKISYITVDSMKGNVIALLSGSGETTRTTVVWTLIAMADHPDKQRKVHEELDAVVGREGSIRWEDRSKVPYTYAALLESMRWATIGIFSAWRIASEDMNIQGYHIPKGTFVTTNNWSLHNDPKYWENPDEFLPERFLLDDGKKVNTSHESFNVFSYGKRSCPGKLQAYMVGFLYFTTIMQKFKLMPKDGEKVKHDTLLGITYQATNVEMRFIPR